VNSGDPAIAEKSLKNVPPRKVINTLFSFLQNTDPKIKWTAVTLMGFFVNKIADEDIRTILEKLKKDEAEIQLYIDQRFIDIRIKDLALDALGRININVA